MSVLDLCCGRGGDLGKWAKQSIHHYVGVDLSGALVAEAARRYQDSYVDRRDGNGQIFKAVWIVNDAGDENNLIDTILKQESSLKDIREPIVFDLVST